MAGPMDFLRNNNMALTQLGIGLLSGQNAQQQAALGAQGLAGALNQNRTFQYIEKINPQLAAEVRLGGRSLDSAWAEIANQRAQAAKPKNDYMAVGKTVFNKSTGEWIAPPPSIGGTDDAEYGLNPQYGVDANGNPVIVQLSKAGTSKQTVLPEGVSLSKEPIKLDAGTHFVLLDPITRQPIGQIPKDLAGAEAQKEIGTAQGKAVASAPGDLQAGLNAKSIIEQIKTSPYLERGTGFSSVGNIVPGTGGYDFQNLVDQAKSGAFLQAVQQMRGLGALSNNEGGAATQAITRMNTATSKEAFLKALSDYEAIIDQGIARAQSRMSGGPAQQPQPGVVDYRQYFGGQ